MKNPSGAAIIANPVSAASSGVMVKVSIITRWSGIFTKVGTRAQRLMLQQLQRMQF